MAAPSRRGRNALFLAYAIYVTKRAGPPRRNPPLTPYSIAHFGQNGKSVWDLGLWIRDLGFGLQPSAVSRATFHGRQRLNGHKALGYGRDGRSLAPAAPLLVGEGLGVRSRRNALSGIKCIQTMAFRWRRL